MAPDADTQCCCTWTGANKSSSGNVERRAARTRRPANCGYGGQSSALSDRAPCAQPGVDAAAKRISQHNRSGRNATYIGNGNNCANRRRESRNARLAIRQSRPGRRIAQRRELEETRCRGADFPVVQRRREPAYIIRRRRLGIFATHHRRPAFGTGAVDWCATAQAALCRACGNASHYDQIAR